MALNDIIAPEDGVYYNIYTKPKASGELNFTGVGFIQFHDGHFHVHEWEDGKDGKTYNDNSEPPLPGDKIRGIEPLLNSRMDIEFAMRFSSNDANPANKIAYVGFDKKGFTYNDGSDHDVEYLWIRR